MVAAMSVHDFIVVGGGSAGCVLENAEGRDSELRGVGGPLTVAPRARRIL